MLYSTPPLYFYWNIIKIILTKMVCNLIYLIIININVVIRIAIVEGSILFPVEIEGYEALFFVIYAY